MLLLAILVVSGCYTWRSAEPVPGEVRRLAKTTEVIRTDGVRFELTRGEIKADSVVGTTGTGRVAIPVQDVARIEEYRLNKRRSIAFGLAVYLGMAFFISNRDVRSVFSVGSVAKITST